MAKRRESTHLVSVLAEAEEQRVDDLTEYLHEHSADAVRNYDNEDEGEDGK
jgi:hypothetical protein